MVGNCWFRLTCLIPVSTSKVACILAIVSLICLARQVSSGSINFQEKYAPPSFIRDIETMFEITQELPSNWLPVYLLHRSHPTVWRQDFPVYDFVHQFFVSAVSPNDSSSVIVAELTPKKYGYGAGGHTLIQPVNKVVTQIIGERNLWYLFVFKNFGEGTISVSTQSTNSYPLFIEIYGSSKYREQFREQTTSLPVFNPNYLTSAVAQPRPFYGPPFVTNSSSFYPPLPQSFTTRSPFWFYQSMAQSMQPWEGGPTAPPLLTPRPQPTFEPPPLLTPRPTAPSPVVVVGPGGQVVQVPLWPPHPVQPGLRKQQSENSNFNPNPNQATWLINRGRPLAPPPPVVYFQPTSSSKPVKLNVLYLAIAFAILAFGALTLCLTLLVMFCCCKRQIQEMEWAPGVLLSDTKVALLVGFLVVASLILIVIGVGVSYLHATNGKIQGVWWHPCRLSTAVICAVIFAVFGLGYATAQFFATRTFLSRPNSTERVPSARTTTITVTAAPPQPAPSATTAGRREAWPQQISPNAPKS